MDTKKLRQKILDLAIRGKLVPQDPNDEPASVLLERIRAEKERLVKEGKIKRSKKSATDTNEYQIPDGWVCCRFDEICSKFSTGPFGSMVHKSDYVSQDGTPIVNPMNIVDGKITTNNLMMVSNEKAQELDRYKLTKDDMLIARRGDLRKCCIVTDNSVNWLCGTGSFFLHAPFVEPRYIEFFYLSEYVQTILKRDCVGATMDNLNQSVLGSIPFLLPPLSEQNRIVNAVERWFTLIDELESNEGDLLKAIDKAKSKILDLAIHGKLVPQDPNDEPAIELLKRINPKFESCDNAIFPFKIPNSWIWSSFFVVYDTISSKPFQILQSKVKETGKIPVISQSSNYIEGYSDQEEFIFKNSDAVLVFGDHTRNLKYIDFDFIVGADGVKILKPLIYAPFTYYSLLPIIEKMRNRGYARHYGVLAKSLIPIPPINEERRIVAKIEELFAVLDSIKESLKV